MPTMRARPIPLSKSCPVCGGRGHAEAKLPVPSSTKLVEFDLDRLAALVEGQSLSLLLALVELLPYKLFSCAKCGTEFKLESHAAKDLVRAMLDSMQPVLPTAKTAGTRSVRRPPEPVAPAPANVVAKANPPKQDEWEVESLDTLFDYNIEKASGSP